MNAPILSKMNAPKVEFTMTIELVKKASNQTQVNLIGISETNSWQMQTNMNLLLSNSTPLLIRIEDSKGENVKILRPRLFKGKIHTYTQVKPKVKHFEECAGYLEELLADRTCAKLPEKGTIYVTYDDGESKASASAKT